MNGIALTVLISQLPKLFGFSIESGGPCWRPWAIGEGIIGGKANWTAFADRRGLVGGDPSAQGKQANAGNPDRGRRGHGRRRRIRSGRARRPVGARPAPTGPARLRDPVDHVGRHRAGRHRRLRGRARFLRRHERSCRASMRARTGTRVDPNQEMVGLGAANLAAGFFQGFPISSSSSRTPVAEAAGAAHAADRCRRRGRRCPPPDRRPGPSPGTCRPPHWPRS